MSILILLIIIMAVSFLPKHRNSHDIMTRGVNHRGHDYVKK